MSCSCALSFSVTGWPNRRCCRFSRKKNCPPMSMFMMSRRYSSARQLRSAHRRRVGDGPPCCPGRRRRARWRRPPGSAASGSASRSRRLFSADAGSTYCFGGAGMYVTSASLRISPRPISDRYDAVKSPVARSPTLTASLLAAQVEDERLRQARRVVDDGVAAVAGLVASPSWQLTHLASKMGWMAMSQGTPRIFVPRS